MRPGVRFDLTGPLPSGTTVIEASAGTGKTYAIVGLAIRYIADGLAELPQLMLVTFGRAATQELRERTRTRLVSTAGALADPATARESDDQLVAYLATGDDSAVRLRRQRLLRALSEFDAATIATTHSFCQQMLDGLGIAGEREPEAVFVESIDDIAEEVISDLYLARYSNEDPPSLPLPDARAAAREAIRDCQARLVPANADPGTLAGRRFAFAEDARAEVQRRKRMRGIRDFDDLLVLLRGTLAHPEHGPAACRRIQQRYRVVLVDEFQDTDPVQWDILRLAFGVDGAGRRDVVGRAPDSEVADSATRAGLRPTLAGPSRAAGGVDEAGRGTTLILVGDPKQAIYAFRGAEVLAYLDAINVADNRAELDVNWRSDAGLLAALERVYGGAALGHSAIVAHPVAPAPAHLGERLPGAAPLRVRYLNRTGCGPLNQSGFPAVGRVRDRIAADLADDIVAFLESGPTLRVDGEPRPLVPSDIAVLVRTRNQVTLVRDALHRADVPAVLAGGTSVFGTEAATAWLRLLHGLEQPHRPDRVRLAALTPLLGVSATELDAGGDDLVTQLGGQLRALAAVFAQAGLAAMFEQLAARTGLDERLLRLDRGERTLTDLRHLAHILNRAATTQSFGITALIRWLSDRMAEDQLVTSADRSRLLDRDSAAVHIVTIHASKGLEFPVVYLPFAWDGGKPSNVESLLLHQDGHRIRDVGGSSGPGFAGRRSQHQREEAGEDLRLLYVAMTRAMCQVVAWWAPTASTRGAPLHRLLMGRSTGRPEPAEKPPIPADAALADAFANWARPADGTIAIEAVPPADPGAPRRWNAPAEQRRGLTVATFTRRVDLLWRRTSYSALTAAAHPSPGVGSETEEVTTIDEPDAPVPAPGERVATGSPTASLMNSLPAGPAFGTLVHTILEHVDTSADDLAAEVRLRCEQEQARQLAPVDVDVLAAALTAALTTPIGQGTLAEVAPADRLAELEFELPLAGAADDGDAQRVTLARMAELLRGHLPADDPLAGYPDLLDTLPTPPLRGFLTGSIDAVLRRAGPEFVVVDYKTNRLVAGPVDAAQFTQEAMAAEMLRAHYPLQALLYLVALHRYLRWRLPGYDPQRHLGGAKYLFVRAMIGPATPAGCGVFTWRPAAKLITGLSDLLDGS